ncbi:MAG: hypothetical protein ABEH90_05775 [Halolamina sp.]
MVSDTVKYGALLLGALFIAATVAGYVGVAAYGALTGDTPSLVPLAAGAMALSLVVTVVGIVWRRRQ